MEEADITLQGLSTNIELKVPTVYKLISAILASKRHTYFTYSVLWSITRKKLIAFPSSYLCGKGFQRGC